jgi:hypothetical protein
MGDATHFGVGFFAMDSQGRSSCVGPSLGYRMQTASPLSPLRIRLRLQVKTVPVQVVSVVSALQAVPAQAVSVAIAVPTVPAQAVSVAIAVPTVPAQAVWVMIPVETLAAHGA